MLIVAPMDKRTYVWSRYKKTAAKLRPPIYLLSILVLRQVSGYAFVVAFHTLFALVPIGWANLAF